MLVTLGEAGVKTLDDLADLSGDELTSRSDGILRNFPLSEADANAIIMAARAHWFAEDDDEVRPRSAGRDKRREDGVGEDRLDRGTRHRRAGAVEPGEDASEPRGPLRRCLVTREVRPKAELLRFVVGPDDRLVPTRRSACRGAVCG